MSPDRSPLRVCPHCGHVYWFDEAKLLGDVDVDKKPEDFYPGAKYSYEPKFEHFVRGIRLGEHDPQKLEYIRIRVWWAGNDARRSADSEEPSALIPLSEAERENLETLYPILLAGDEGQRLLGAEVLRELGRFEECLAILEGATSPRLSTPADLIRSLAMNGDSVVAEIHRQPRD